jgi:type IV secretory pathway TraG/TraD family ATPase VirD4
MPAATRPSLISGFLVAGAFMFGGWYVTREYIHWYAWGLGMIALGFVLLIKQLLVFLGYLFQAAEQLSLLHESRTVFYAHGAARLARRSDPFIQAMSEDTRGIFLGALDGLPLFYDPFAKGNGHMLVYAPSRTGKTVSLVIPALLH